MPTMKRILCLANSKKLSGRCVAGREVLDSGPGSWNRPVSARVPSQVDRSQAVLTALASTRRHS